MTIASNLYAEKVFSEQPLALWALDDELNFLSVLPENANQAESWTTNAEDLSITYSNDYTVPIKDSFTIVATGATPTTTQETLNLRYSSVANFLDLNHYMKSLSIAFYLNAPGIEINQATVSLVYNDPLTLEQVQIAKSYSFLDNGWGFVGSTIQIPEVNATFDVEVSIEYSAGASSYDFFINGFSVGQWSEDHQTLSTGSYAEALPSIIATNQEYGVEARSYGLSDRSGYYIATEKQSFARNIGAPIVYGTSSSTRIYPNSGPSVIMPGFGVMNQSGKYRENTIEFWMRVDTTTKDAKRVFGPIGKILKNGIYEDSSDGLYILGDSLVLKLGDYRSSYFVGEWARPMLIDIKIGEKFAGMSINGEDVMSFAIDASKINFPEKFIFDNESQEYKDQDWLGFFSYEDLSIFEIDAFGIYPYRVQSVVAKRRFVYGQGVDFPENLNTAYNGASAFIDYSFANYTNNYNYPDLGKWGQGAIDNISINGNSFSAPNYDPPSVIFSDSSLTYESWLEANNSDNMQSSDSRPYITLRPGGWEAEDGYLLFNKLNGITQEVASIYAIFKPTELSNTEQTLLHIENEITSNYFSITLTGNLIKYNFKYGSSSQVIYSVETIVPDLAFSVGINIKNLVNTYGSNIRTFFGSRDQLKVYVGGSKNFSSTFSGKIYSVGFATARNSKKIESFFTSSGFAELPSDLTDIFYLFFDTSEDGQIDFTVTGGYIDPISGYWTSFDGTLDGGAPDSFVFGRFQDHIASYTMVPKTFIDKLFIDVACDSYWEDYLPLTYFGSYVSSGNDEKVFDLDFIQFNISNPVPVFPGTTEDSIVRTYVAFQYLSTGANASDDYFVYREPVSSSHVVIPTENWMQTKYEVVSGDVIKMPSGADFNDLAIGIYVEIKNPGIKEHPVKITSLQLASQALNYTVENPVGTRFGYDIYPYYRGGVYFNYKNIRPYSIYKSNTPYLFMSKTSGIKLCDSTGKSGISIPINKTLVTEYAVGATQFAMQYQEGLFPSSPIEIFEVESSNLYIKFYLVAENASRSRGKVYGINQATKTPVSGIAYYKNGVLVKDLYIESNSWVMLGIQFSDALLFDAEVGAIRLTGPVLFNNISYYQLPSTQTSLSVIFRRWNQLSELASYWEDLVTPTQLLWQDILYISSQTTYSIDPSIIFKEYTGTNRIIVSSDSSLLFNNYRYSVYKDVEWFSSVVTPV